MPRKRQQLGEEPSLVPCICGGLHPQGTACPLSGEILLNTYSPLLSSHTIQRLVQALECEVLLIGTEVCMLGDIRVDEANHQIYGRARKIEALGRYE